MSIQEKPDKMDTAAKGRAYGIGRLKAAAHPLEPVVWIGKSGLTPEVIGEIKKQLRKKRLIKVKLLKSALQDEKKKELAERIAREAGASLVAQVGHVAVLYKKEGRT